MLFCYGYFVINLNPFPLPLSIVMAAITWQLDVCSECKLTKRLVNSLPSLSLWCLHVLDTGILVLFCEYSGLQHNIAGILPTVKLKHNNHRLLDYLLVTYVWMMEIYCQDALTLRKELFLLKYQHRLTDLKKQRVNDRQQWLVCIIFAKHVTMCENNNINALWIALNIKKKAGEFFKPVHP